jgi:hypothetical protein
MKVLNYQDVNGTQDLSADDEALAGMAKHHHIGMRAWRRRHRVLSLQKARQSDDASLENGMGTPGEEMMPLVSKASSLEAATGANGQFPMPPYFQYPNTGPEYPGEVMREVAWPKYELGVAKAEDAFPEEK